MSILSPVIHPGITIQLKSVSKKFGSEWIYKKIDATFTSGNQYAIVGPNGSGKSTLLKMIAGIITPNKGEVIYTNTEGNSVAENVFSKISFCAPYMDLPEELTLSELLQFHTSFRNLTISSDELISLLQINVHKEIRNYSSGMKQRVKLALAFYTQADILLLDEPTANLDETWIALYLKLINETTVGKIVVISSNIPAEYNFCNTVLKITDYKK
ncbi:MAG: ABC transporter ATP-binding protein [Chitinophagales bacterium]